MQNRDKDTKDPSEIECLGCGAILSDPTEENKMGEEFICDKCRKEMMDSLEGAWIRHSAFLD